MLSGTEIRAATCGRSRGRELYARLLGRNKSRDRGATLPANIGRLYRQHQAGSETGSCSDLGLAGSGSDPSNYDGEFVDAQSHPCVFHELRELLLPTAPTVQFRQRYVSRCRFTRASLSVTYTFLSAVSITQHLHGPFSHTRVPFAVELNYPVVSRVAANRANSIGPTDLRFKAADRDAAKFRSREPELRSVDLVGNRNFETAIRNRNFAAGFASLGTRSACSDHTVTASSISSYLPNQATLTCQIET